MALNERDFFTEKRESKPMSLSCPQCRHRDDYDITWLRRTKKCATTCTGWMTSSTAPSAGVVSKSRRTSR
jgi:hypothetical protein